jgi:hypothetical protein
VDGLGRADDVMPLNHLSGERVEGMDAVWRVVPVEKYQQQERLTTTVKRMTTGKFKRLRDVEMPIFQAAWEHAQIAFANSGAPAGAMHVDIIAQEYPRTGQVCFIFAGRVFGSEMFVTAPFQLSQEQIADLALRDLWQPHRLN